MKIRLTDEQWNIVKPVLCRRIRMETRGRPRLSDRAIFESILWLIDSGWRPWRRIKYNNGDSCPSFQTCYRRFSEWSSTGALDKAVEALAIDMETRGKIPLKNCFFSDSFYKNRRKPLLIRESSLSFEDIIEPWPLNMKLLFQNKYIWRYFFLHAKSPWILQRIPKNLAHRENLLWT